MTHAARLATPARLDATSGVRRRITTDSLWLFSGYAVTAASGFVFWVLAAVWIPQIELGISASILSIVMAAAALASNGPGSALVVMLPLGGGAARAVLARAYVATVVIAAGFGAAAGILVAALLPTGLPAAAVIALTTAFTTVWAMFNTQTLALAGAGDAQATLFVNGSANLVKLALLFVFALPFLWMPHALVVATIVPAAAAVLVSVAILVPRALRREDRRAAAVRQWDAALARSFRVFAVQNSVAVGLVLCVGLSLSFVVTLLASPAEGAIFAIAFQFGAALDLLGVGVATALARSASTQFQLSAALAGGYAWKVVAFVLVMGLGATLVTPVMFMILGRGYTPLYGMAVVGALAAASAIRPGYDLWSALSRARQRVMPVLLGNALYVAILLILVIALVPRFGALGAALSVTGGAVALAVVGATGLHRANRPTPHRTVPEGIAA
ncbi:Membrane protein involved in the export of O-antigen and teichoic acid [Microbacterium sp. cf046]|uniref:hypothetical protein n=1 Tax=Microbacterium sp. cf046 TaxID=1761803 RepID=UPI0008ECDB37|nr:hypothetical protein [Microbacterium sp. cf046]SFS00732.1 Membrane protein involved in the export of O-antigen and teichoic acid [Microbacterium sp. cf046]